MYPNTKFCSFLAVKAKLDVDKNVAIKLITPHSYMKSRSVSFIRRRNIRYSGKRGLKASRWRYTEMKKVCKQFLIEGKRIPILKMIAISSE